ncbi:hypothetical protein A1Q1_04574 [Trichosporon asahii var. asahii CBS 2479]|uniref:Uncharacterized protein n=1 Tax=Trichosporon asahii var. asahii (strain ATCC 90039 / CBS 2479 / JCM 2466 / KCTC 7840 / NBRC 103889/ NCYC 2677 / UAMH 7654) TaxID=1186058 RepID=J5RFG6_TRIAS|nr:hypothetical protein A1Q1_04574 [Trichosporon asahii var. asahii CBS 2479]EJT52363.1 hypothetical protein A1Q1_04574 [Trichosporon asahii var. asahii CBS 2479]
MAMQSPAVGHPPERCELEPSPEQNEAVENLVRCADNVKAAGEEALREALGIEHRAKDVARAASDDVVEPHHVARVLDALPERDVAAGNDGRQTQANEGQRAVPAMSAVMRREHHVARCDAGADDAGHVHNLQTRMAVEAVVHARQDRADDEHDDADLTLASRLAHKLT